jgi:hypothetical protein
MGRWRQTIEPFQCDLAAYVDLYIGEPPPLWRGQSAASEPLIAISINPALVTNFWQVNLLVAAPPVFYGIYTWVNVFVDPTKPFDTGLLYDTLPDDENSRLVRIML